MGQEFKYFAFISYNSHDTAWGKKLQRKLEGYRMPVTLCSKHGWERKSINPVFFAPSDIQPGILTEELKDRLRYIKTFDCDLFTSLCSIGVGGQRNRIFL